jgi:hypothetical protein
MWNLQIAVVVLGGVVVIAGLMLRRRKSWCLRDLDADLHEALQLRCTASPFSPLNASWQWGHSVFIEKLLLAIST